MYEEYEMDLAEMTADMKMEMDDETLEDMAAWYATQYDRDDGMWEYGEDQG